VTTSYFQHELTLPPFPRGLHVITRQVEGALPELPRVTAGLLHVFILHTSASLTINENADPDVPRDLASALDALAPEDFPYRHTVEGPDDMPAHVKAMVTDTALTIPIRDGRLCLGTWQGIFLCEHRNRAGGRRLVLTLQGETA
jgi:secondary thiamine-phosphate synthase enzyme